MGEIIEKIGQLRIAGRLFDVELNEAYNTGGELSIHVQNEKVRFECTETEFLQIASLIMRANENFNYYKNRK